MNPYQLYKYAAENDNQFYSNRLSRDIGMGFGAGLAACALNTAAVPLALKGHANLALAAGGLRSLAGLAGAGYGIRGLYDAYKQYATRPEKTASALETFVATIR